MATRIRARRQAQDVNAGEPVFLVTTNRARCEIQISSDPILFPETLASRRSADNFCSSGIFQVIRGELSFTMPADSWRRLRRHPSLYYRAITFNRGSGGARASVERTVEDADYRTAPSVALYAGASGIATLRNNISGSLSWLRVDRNRILNEAGDIITLRGITRSGMEFTPSNAVDPRGRTKRSQAEAAGITASEIAEICSVWKANIIRLPINQAWALTRPAYVADLDIIINWASAQRAYVLLSVAWMDSATRFGSIGAAPCHLPAMPDENTVRLWRFLSTRYKRQSAVLYELLQAPHSPLPGDASTFTPPGPAVSWTVRWHQWVRRLEQVIHGIHPKALLFVSGTDWGLDLRTYPIPKGGSGFLENTVYATQIRFTDPLGRSTRSPADFETWFGFERLRRSYPVFIGSFGECFDLQTPDVAAPPRNSGGARLTTFAQSLEGYVRERSRFTNGAWPGVCGWTASSWGGAGSLVVRRQGSGGSRRWHTFERDGNGLCLQTELGEFVFAALRTMPSRQNADFDPARPAGSRVRDSISVATGRHHDFFPVWGHDFSGDTRVRFIQGSTRVLVRPRLVLPHMLLIASLPTNVPVGVVDVEAVRPGGATTQRVRTSISNVPALPSTVLCQGSSKPSPYTLSIVGAPAIRRLDGTIVANPMTADRIRFHYGVARILRSLFGIREAFLHPYAHEIRVIASFWPADTAVAANALCYAYSPVLMAPDRSVTDAYVQAKGVRGDVVFVLHTSNLARQSSAFGVSDAGAIAAPYAFDALNGNHLRGYSTPGSIALFYGAYYGNQNDLVTPLHEMMHASSGYLDDHCGDQYADVPITGFVINRKRKASAAAPRPALFARYESENYRTDPDRDSLGYSAAWLSYNPKPIDRLRPCIMDNFPAGNQGWRSRLDHITMRFMRDRIEAKLGR